LRVIKKTSARTTEALKNLLEASREIGGPDVEPEIAVREVDPPPCERTADFHPTVRNPG